jgi:hypothetical protein
MDLQLLLYYIRTASYGIYNHEPPANFLIGSEHEPKELLLLVPYSVSLTCPSNRLVIWWYYHDAPQHSRANICSPVHHLVFHFPTQFLQVVSPQCTSARRHTSRQETQPPFAVPSFDVPSLTVVQCSHEAAYGIPASVSLLAPLNR